MTEIEMHLHLEVTVIVMAPDQVRLHEKEITRIITINIK